VEFWQGLPRDLEGEGMRLDYRNPDFDLSIVFICGVLKKQNQLQLNEQSKKNEDIQIKIDQLHNLLEIDVQSIKKYLSSEWIIIFHSKENKKIFFFFYLS
jgi:hypothetical protein